MGHRVAQGNPAAIGAPDIAAQIAGRQIDLRLAVGLLECDPADVCAVGVAAQVAGVSRFTPKSLAELF